MCRTIQQLGGEEEGLSMELAGGVRIASSERLPVEECSGLGLALTFRAETPQSWVKRAVSVYTESNRENPKWKSRLIYKETIRVGT